MLGLELKSSILELDLPSVENRIRSFIKNYLENSGAKGVVLGMSGGIDSNTIAALCALAIGGNEVLGLMLPERETKNSADISDARIVAEKFGIQTLVCDITPPLEEFYKQRYLKYEYHKDNA